jgi:hypothetical protein
MTKVLSKAQLLNEGVSREKANRRQLLKKEKLIEPVSLLIANISLGDQQNSIRYGRQCFFYCQLQKSTIRSVVFVV